MLSQAITVKIWRTLPFRYIKPVKKHWKNYREEKDWLQWLVMNSITTSKNILKK